MRQPKRNHNVVGDALAAALMTVTLVATFSTTTKILVIDAFIPQLQHQQHLHEHQQCRRNKSIGCRCHAGRQHRSFSASLNSRVSLSLLARRDDEDDDDEGGELGMADAFRQLDALDSLDDGDDDDDKNRKIPNAASMRPSGGIVKPNEDIIPGSNDGDKAVTDLPIEKEIQVYQDMVKDLETKKEDDLYTDVLSGMGVESSDAIPKKAPESTTTTSTTTSSKSDDDRTIITIEEGKTVSSSSSTFSNDDDDQLRNQELMNQALKEALEDVKVSNPSISESILDDREIMKEIEKIFERGNDKLLSSLEDIRKEQSELARLRVTQDAQARVDVMDEDARRLEQAQQSMAGMIARVNKERADVQKAVDDLKAAQAEMDKDLLSKLKSGGVIKQTSFVGLVLFSVRSIIDTISALSDPSLLVPALVQGAIAILCAAIFFLT